MLAGAFATGMWIDAAQTREAQRRGGWRELNPILGPHPSNGQVNAYFAGSAVVVLGAAAIAPRPWRAILLATGATLEALVIAHSVSLGVGVRF